MLNVQYARNIAASVGGSSESIWLSQVSAITITLLGPIIAQAADYWGRKWFVVLTTLLGFVGCIVVSRANSMGEAIVGQVLAALGYSSQALLNAIASEILPRRLRPAAQGGLGLTSGLGAAFSLIFGFHMVEVSTDGWRVYWYVTAGLMLAATIVFTLAYNPSPRPLQAALSTVEKIQRLDWAAYALMAAGLVPLNIALTWSDNPYTWSNAHVSAPFAVGIVALIAFAVHQILIKKDGLCHHDLFKKDHNCAIAFLCIFAEGLSFFSVNNFFPSEMSILYEPDTFRVGLRASITFFAAIASALAVSVYSSITKDIRHPIIAAYALIVLYTSKPGNSSSSSYEQSLMKN
jgi:MFS family permease